MGDRGPIMTEDERLKLVKWAYSMIKDMRELPHGRSDYFLYPNDTKVHELVWQVKKRIVDREGLRLSKPEPLYKDFLGMIHKGGKIHKHKDENEGSLIHSRFNVILQHSGSGETYYNDKPLRVKEGSYVLCRSGMEYHWTDENDSDKERISLSFGYLLPPTFVSRLYDKFPLSAL
jgi:hypothetical protein